MLRYLTSGRLAGRDAEQALGRLLPCMVARAEVAPEDIGRLARDAGAPRSSCSLPLFEQRNSLPRERHARLSQRAGMSPEAEPVPLAADTESLVCEGI